MTGRPADPLTTIREALAIAWPEGDHAEPNIYTEALASLAAVERLVEAARRVDRIYEGLRTDENDGMDCRPDTTDPLDRIEANIALLRDMHRDYPLLSEKARAYDFAERLGGCSDPLMAEIDAALRELWDARRYVTEESSRA